MTDQTTMRESGIVDSTCGQAGLVSARCGRGRVARPFVGEGSAQDFGAWRKRGLCPLVDHGTWPWGRVIEPGRLNENQTGSGLRKNYIMDFGEMY